LASAKAQQAKAKVPAGLDLSAFPPTTVRRFRRYVCLACIFDLFTKRLKMAPRTAYTAVRGHTPSVAELTGPEPSRPYFDSADKFPHCPHCDASKGKLAGFEVIRLEGSRATTAARKQLFDSLPKAEGAIEIVEEQASRRDLLFQWLDDLGRRFDFDQPDWLMEAARAYLEKREPKTAWSGEFATLSHVRRSHRLEEGWQREGPRLYLSPTLFDEILLIQYLVSRSHRAGGYTFEGRLTLPELLRRLYNRGFLAQHGVTGEDPAEFLQNLVDALDPGSASMKVYYLIDRREFLEKTRAVYARYA